MPAEEYYEDQYGWFGKLYYELGFNNLYSSWWYLVFIAMIGISLVICSLDRVVPLYKALKAQRVTRHEGFLKRQRVFGISKNVDENDLRAEIEEIEERNMYIANEIRIFFLKLSDFRLFNIFI